VDISAPGEELYLADRTLGTTGYSQTQGTSFAAPTVAGGAGLLVDYAKTYIPAGATQAAALDGRIIKAVLLNSADKTAGWNNGQTFASGTWTTGQSLDPTTGAGRMDLSQAFAQYGAAGVSQNPAPGNVNATGWALGTVTKGSSNSYFFTSSLTAGTEINATLSWFVNRFINNTGSTVGGIAPDGTAEVAFHNLDLEVWRVTGPGGSLIGSAPVARSNSFYNVVEHVSFLVPADGFYMVRVVRPSGAPPAGMTVGTNGDAGTVWDFGTPGGAGPSNTTDYGVAWLSRPSFTAATNTTTQSASATFANGLIAAGPFTATAAVTGSGTALTFTNSLYVGGNDLTTTQPGTLTVGAGATVTVNNTLRLRAASTATAAGTLSVGAVVADPGSSFVTGTGGNAGAITVTTTGAGVVTLGGDGAMNISGGISGPGGITKVGAGNLVLTGASSYTGATVIGGGTTPGTTTSQVQLFAQGTLGNTSALTINNNSTLYLNNLFLGFQNNRIPDTAPVALNGGRIQYDARGGTANVEQLGAVTATGMSQIVISSTSTGGTTSEMNFGTFSNAPATDQGTLFVSTLGTSVQLGAPAGPNVANVRFSGGLTQIGGIVPFAVANASGFSNTTTNPIAAVTYDATNGVQALNFQTAFVQATASTNPFTAGANNNFNPASGFATISADVTINALGVNGTFGNPQLTGNRTLTVSSGFVAAPFGLEVNGSTIAFGTTTGYFYLGIGSGGPFSTRFLNAGNITGSAGVVVSSLTPTNNIFDLTGMTVANTFTGGLFVNGSAVVAFTNDNQLGANTGGLTLGGGTLRDIATSAVSLSASRTLRLGQAGGTLEVTQAAGALMVNGQVTGPGDLTKAGAGSLTLANGTNNYAGLTNILQGTLTTTAAGTLPTTTVVTLGTPNSATAGTLDLLGNGQTVAGITLGSGNTGGASNVITTSTTAATLTVSSNTADSVFSGKLTGANLSLTKSGSSALTLASGVTHDYGGVTTVNGGSLYVNGTLAAGGGAVTVGAGTPNTGRLGGTGTINRAATIDNGGTVAPGTSSGIGTLTVGANVNFNGGGFYSWRLNAVPSSGTQGTNWDFLSSTGTLGGTATAASPFTIAVTAAGTAAGFNNTNSYTWPIATFSGGISLPNSAFVVTTSGFIPGGLNDPGAGVFTALVSGNGLSVQFSPVPEPATILLLCAGAAGGWRGWRRLRRPAA
jgi:fibronectin-binding autotransporter adhesin